MAHPYAEHRQTKKEHSRVGHITKGYASGGAVNRTEDDRKVRKMSASQEREVNPEGGVSPHRADRPKRAKGGKVKGKHNSKTIVNVITGGHPAGGAVPPMPAPPMGIAPPGAMPPPMAAKPPMPIPGPGMPPPGGLPPMPMRAKGGRVHGGSGKGYGPAWKEGLKAGTQVSHDDGKNDLVEMNRGRQITFKSGGAVKSFRAYGGKVESPDGVAKATRLPGGGGGGEARLAKAHRAARK